MPLDGNKWNHICRADARMNPLLSGQVDQLRRLACPAHRRLDHRRRIARHRHHRAVVRRIHRPVKQPHSIYAHRGHNRLDPPGIPPLGEVRYALDYRFAHDLLDMILGCNHFQKV